MKEKVVDTLLLVDDNPFNRDGISMYLRTKGFRILEAGDHTTAWQLAIQEQPDAAVIDIVIPMVAQGELSRDTSLGLQLARKLKTHYPALGIVLLSAYEDRGREFLAMIEAGLRGLAYKLKGCQPDTLLTAIHAVQAGQIIIDPEVTTFRLSAHDFLALLNEEERCWVEKTIHSFNDLTPREREVAYLAAASHNTESIAQKLCVTPKTVENYISRIYRKLGFDNMDVEAPHLRKVVVLAKALMLYELSADYQTNE